MHYLITAILAFSAFLARPSLAQNSDIAYVRWLSLKKFSLELNKLQEYQDPYSSVYASPTDKQAEERWDNRIAAHFDADILSIGKFGIFSQSTYWVLNTDRQTPRLVGLDGKFGATWNDTLNIFYQQKSERLLEETDLKAEFPRHSWIGVSITFYERPKY